MKKLLILLACVLVALAACTKSKEVHPEIGDGNDEIVTVGMKDVHVEYTRTDHAELQKVVFHYNLTEAQQFVAAEMTKRETFFELTLNDLLSDTLYCYYYELFPNGSSAYQTEQKTFHTQAFDAPEPPDSPVVNLPTVFTTEVYEITTNSAQCGGEVTDDGGAEVTECGICWSTNANPTISDSHVASGLGIGSFTSQMNGLTANITYHVRAYATNSVGTAYGLVKEFTTLSGGGGSGDHDYVDLGLPSGTLWAACNVGANTPEGYGNYYAWAEIETKTYYYWEGYKYGRTQGSGHTFVLQFTKYCNMSIYGYHNFTDTLTVLQSMDDAAMANWGSDWRMPTGEEMEELIENTTHTWTTQNGVIGSLFTAANGNSLFLPAAGKYIRSELKYAGVSCCYHSSSLSDDDPWCAQGFYLNTNSNDYFENNRTYGCQVRAVRSMKKK